MTSTQVDPFSYITRQRPTYAPEEESDFDESVKIYRRPGYARQRYQFVLARVLFCCLTYTDPETGEQQELYFYKDGTVGAEDNTDAVLMAWAVAPWSGDYNVAFWEMRNAARRLCVDDAAYSFSFDPGLQQLLAQAA